MLRILLIDDDQVDRTAVRRALKASGLEHELVEAADGAAGLRLSEAQAFDCVLLDYRLPDIDAFDVLSALLASPQGNLAVLILTGETDQDLAFRLMRAGALDYLSKAEVTPSSLARAIRYARARYDFLTELEAARREAEEKSELLDALNKQKTLLFSIIAHDLRNPFQAVLGLAEMLSRGVANKDPAGVQKRAEGVYRAASQASKLMESLFTWADVQMNTAGVEMAPLQLADVVREVLEGAHGMAADKGVELRASDCDVLVQAQRDMLFAVLRNLVSNAVKFTLPGGQVTVTASPAEAGVEIRVSDTGVGIAPHKIGDLFKPDRRSTTVGTAGELGSGLGLILCRELMQRQGRELHVRSQLGEGTTFYFDLAAPYATAESDRLLASSSG